MEENKITNITEDRIENRVQLTKVYLGSGDDYIFLSGNDITIFDKFASAGNKIVSISNEMESNIEKIKEKYKDSGEDSQFSEIHEIIEERKRISKESENIMDSVLGEGSTRKFFGDVYEVIPDFVPDTECFLDFWDSLIPAIERLTGHKGELVSLASKKRMDKYKPQDHKRKLNK